MPTLRTFIAVEIDDDTRNKISQIQNSFKNHKTGIKLVAPNNIHITLIFIGNIEISKISEIDKELQSFISAIKPFEILPKKIGYFPNIKNPKIIWIGIEDGKEILIKLNEKIKPLLKNCKITTEDRDFHPHITIGRIKSSNNTEKLKTVLLNLPEQRFNPIYINSISLIESNLTPEGPQYKTIVKWELSKNE